MKLKIAKNELLRAIFKAQGIIDRRTTYNILSHILMETKGKTEVKITCTDYDVTLISHVPAEVIEDGAAAINGRNLYEIIRSLPEADVMLTKLSNNWMELVSGKAVFKIVGLLPDDYPKISEPPKVQELAIPKEAFLDMVEKTGFCMSDDESRLNINGIYLNIIPEDSKDYRFIMVATDGHRLSKTERVISLDTGEFKEVECIIHRRGITELKRFLEGGTGNLKIGFHHKNVIFGFEKSILNVRQIDEVYPNWQMVVPQDFNIQLALNKKEIEDIIKRVSQVSSQKSSMIKFKLLPEKLKVYTENPEYGEGVDELNVPYSGTEVEIAYNFHYFLDALAAIKGDQTIIDIRDSNSATKITSKEDEGTTEIVMPMRL